MAGSKLRTLVPRKFFFPEAVWNIIKYKMFYLVNHTDDREYWVRLHYHNMRRMLNQRIERLFRRDNNNNDYFGYNDLELISRTFYKIPHEEDFDFAHLRDSAHGRMKMWVQNGYFRQCKKCKIIHMRTDSKKCRCLDPLDKLFRAGQKRKISTENTFHEISAGGAHALEFFPGSVGLLTEEAEQVLTLTTFMSNEHDIHGEGMSQDTPGDSETPPTFASLFA